VDHSHAPADRFWAAGFGLIATASFVFWFSVYANATLLPLSMQDAGFAEGAIGLAFGIGAIASLLGRVISGWAIDRWGARLFLALGALCLAVTSPLLPLAGRQSVILACRVAQGFGLGFFSNAAIGYVAHTARPAVRGTAVAWLGAVNPGAVAVSPVLAFGPGLIGGTVGVAFGAFPAAATAPPSRRADRGAESSDMLVSGHAKRGS
jgi:AAHS family benzoate transporter-like MFS transporter